MKLFELYTQLLETRKTEEGALRLMKNYGYEGNHEELLNKLKNTDNSESQQNLAFITHFNLKDKIDLEVLKKEFNDYNEFKEKIGKLYVDKNGVKLDNQPTNWLKFTEKIHGTVEAQRRAKQGKEQAVSVDFEAKYEPIMSSNGIDVYQAEDVGRCIQYTQGGLTDKKYSFCVGQWFPGNAYAGYRVAGSTFYFIVDKNKFEKKDDGSVILDDPLHMVVYDIKADGDVKLTDQNNSTGTIAEFGSDVRGYQNYLKKMGIDVNKMVSIPFSKEEEEENEKLDRRNTNLSWFKDLTNEEIYKYIMRIHVLSDEQFDYLWKNK
tara:strand:- start:39 stop:998 length:960 start_codon:yes stop_codon:yes gene_type:complete